MALYHAWAQIHLGWALSQLGTAPGLDEIEAGVREVRQIGAGRLAPFYTQPRRRGLRARGRPDEARMSVAQAFAALAQSRDLAFAAELHRMRAVLALRHGAGGRDADEADLRHALEIARQQEARSLELRAARDLASMLAARGERQQAHGLLAPVYDWFTEGFDTRPRGSQGADRQAPCLVVRLAGAMGRGCGWSMRTIRARARSCRCLVRQHSRVRRSCGAWPSRWTFTPLATWEGRRCFQNPNPAVS